ncbi:MAG: NrdH-redoxin [Dehalococcoidia bacterium]|nr:NrdH-redoxin [Dehalococcoidia bacterium]
MARITVYGKVTCEDTIRSRKLLDAKRIAYDWVDVELSAEGRRIAAEKNNGKLNTPTIVFDDGAVLVEPSDEQLAKKVGIKLP